MNKIRVYFHIYNYSASYIEINQILVYLYSIFSGKEFSLSLVTDYSLRLKDCSLCDKINKKAPGRVVPGASVSLHCE